MPWRRYAVALSFSLTLLAAGVSAEAVWSVLASQDVAAAEQRSAAHTTIVPWCVVAVPLGASGSPELTA